MKPTDPNHPWQRLVTLARKTERDTSAPFGFATRVTARALAQPRWHPSLLEIFAPRALGIACLLMLASIALNYGAFMSPNVDWESTLSEEQPAVAALFDAS